jgi:hypothetical protein
MGEVSNDSLEGGICMGSFYVLGGSFGLVIQDLSAFSIALYPRANTETKLNKRYPILVSLKTGYVFYII